jgi:hypothetical protein
MNRSGNVNIFELGLESAMLCVESFTVIGLRCAVVAQGGQSSLKEMQLMTSEKLSATMQLQTALVSGKFGSEPVSAGRQIIAMYRRKVQQNLLRLSGKI